MTTDAPTEPYLVLTEITTQSVVFRVISRCMFRFMRDA